MSKDLTEKFSIEFEEEARIFQNLNEINRFATSFGGAYDLAKWLKSGFGYTWIYRHDVDDSFWDNRHRYYLYLIGKAKIGRLKLSLHGAPWTHRIPFQRMTGQPAKTEKVTKVQR